MQINTGETTNVETVVKLGGSTLVHSALFDGVVRAICVAARWRRLLVVPGGGLFADAVREADRRVRLSDDTAHWMAVMAMDQSAHVVSCRLDGGVVITSVGEIASVLAAGGVPVLAPARWLQEADPLPHSWDVTSDSIAAWVAGRVGARNLVLIKPQGVGVHYSGGFGETDWDSCADDAAVGDLVDAYFPTALPDDVTWTIVPGDQVETLTLAMGGPSS